MTEFILEGAKDDKCGRMASGLDPAAILSALQNADVDRTLVGIKLDNARKFKKGGNATV